MIVDRVQRWKGGRDSYRPSRETIRTSDYDVAQIAEDGPAKAFVLAHHYSSSYPAARRRFGLYRGRELVGVAVFSHPASEAVLSSVFPDDPHSSMELGRFVLLDDVPANGETWFLGRIFELLRKIGVVGVVSFSDPVPRRTAAGSVVMPGHVGTIYQAFNGVYLGRGRARTLRILPDGTVFSDRAASKLRARDKGWRYAARILERHGARLLGESDDSRAWLAEWLPKLTRSVRHGGNHKYAWAVDRAARRVLPRSLPYPKMKEA